MRIKELSVSIVLTMEDVIQMCKDEIPASMELNENEEYYMSVCESTQQDVTIEIIKRKRYFYFSR